VLVRSAFAGGMFVLYEAVELEIGTTLFKKASNGKYMRPEPAFSKVDSQWLFFYGYKETLPFLKYLL
jgi:hypothetical protein